MDNHDIYNWDNQNLKAGSIAEGLAAISEVMYKISHEITRVSTELVMKEVQNESIINDIENLQKQIAFLTNELNEIKKNTR